MKRQRPGLVFHHVSIVAPDYRSAVEFYVDYLGLRIYGESYSYNRNARKLELYCRGEYVIELFVKEKRGSGLKIKEERSGLDHVAFLTEDVEEMLRYLKEKGVRVSEVREDMRTGRKYGFCQDPDGTKIEFYEG